MYRYNGEIGEWMFSIEIISSFHLYVYMYVYIYISLSHYRVIYNQVRERYIYINNYITTYNINSITQPRDLQSCEYEYEV